jgi:ABC-2 type transport system ATP-binding protein
LTLRQADRSIGGTGIRKKREVKKANLEDVFLSLTGKEWRDE